MYLCGGGVAVILAEQSAPNRQHEWSSAVQEFCPRENGGSPTYLVAATVRKLLGKLTELFYCRCLSASDLGLPNCIIAPATLSARGCWISLIVVLLHNTSASRAPGIKLALYIELYTFIG